MAKKSKNNKALIEEVAPAEEVKEKKPAQPVSTPSKVVQLTPIIQPIAFVPYSTQEQELYMEGPEEEEEAPIPQEEEAVAPKKKVSVAAIFLMIFSLLIIAVFVAGKWVLQEYLACVGSVSGLDVTLDYIEAQDWTDIVSILVTVIPVCAVLVFISSLIRIMHKGACVFAMIFALIGIAASLAAILMLALDDAKGSEVGYGLYAMAALSLINMLIAFLAKREPKKADVAQAADAE